MVEGVRPRQVSVVGFGERAPEEGALDYRSHFTTWEAEGLVETEGLRAWEP